MRKITQKASNSLVNWTYFKEWNTIVDFHIHNRWMLLHWNHIATYDKENHQLLIQDCNRKSNVTRERLNWILNTLKVWSISRKWNKWIIHSRKNWDIERDWQTKIIDLREF